MTNNVQPPAGIRLIRTLTELKAWRAESDEDTNLVPTMGALHSGHLSLVDAANRQPGRTIVSIFVNPLQFGQGEDLDRYPRNLETDLTMLSTLTQPNQADPAQSVTSHLATGRQEIAVYVPSIATMYPDGADSDRQTRVRAGNIGNAFEGLARPGHFDGMLTVVLKLFGQVQPVRAFFGKKDAQQLFLIRRMVKDFSLEVAVVGSPIIREADGLALSSRNLYLSATERELGLLLSKSLAAVRDNSGQGVQQALEAGVDILASNSLIKLEYLVAVYPETFIPLPAGYTGPAIVLVAAVVGNTRLIDNLDIDF